MLKVLARILNIEIKEFTLSETLLKIIEIEKKKKKLKEIVRCNRRLNIVKAKIAITKAKSSVSRLFNSLWEICKKMGTIYGACRIILDVVERVNQLIHNKSRNGSFLFVV